VENLLRNGVDRDFRGLSQVDVHDIGLVDLTSAVMIGLSGDGHERAALRVLDADNNRLAFAYRKIGDHAVKGRGISGFLQQGRCNG